MRLDLLLELTHPSKLDKPYAFWHAGCMRFLKISFVVALLLALMAPGTLTDIGHGLKGMASSAASAVVTNADASEMRRAYEDRDAHRLACTLYRKWSKADDATRKASASAVASIAERAAKTTTDPAAKALLTVIPAAVGHGTSVPSRSAQLLIKRECRPGN